MCMYVYDQIVVVCQQNPRGQTQHSAVSFIRYKKAYRNETTGKFEVIGFSVRGSNIPIFHSLHETLNKLIVYNKYFIRLSIESLQESNEHVTKHNNDATKNIWVSISIKSQTKNE